MKITYTESGYKYSIVIDTSEDRRNKLRRSASLRKWYLRRLAKKIMEAILTVDDIDLDSIKVEPKSIACGGG